MTRENEGQNSELNALIENADSVFALFTALGRITSTFGFTHFTLMDMPADNTKPAHRRVHFTSLPHPFISADDQASLLRDTARTTPQLGELSLFEWSVTELSGLDISKEVLEPRLKAMHINMGAVFSASGLEQDGLVLLLFGNRTRLSEIEKRKIDSLALSAFERFEELRPGSLLRPLSSRELEVIKWSAEGKTSHEIGKILSLSDHTVNAYLANAIRKLECVNRTQLVAKALRLRLIE